MDATIFTPRLKLTLMTKAERGSPEFAWLHELFCDEQAQWWSILGKSKSLEDSEERIQGKLPIAPKEAGEGDTVEKWYRIAYAIHMILDQPNDNNNDKPTQFIGLITLRSLNSGQHALELPEHLTLPASSASTTLTLELAYMFLPRGWGKGFATESLPAVFEACKRATSRGYWEPWRKVYVRVIVNGGNPASLRVMEKMEKVEGLGMRKRGVFEWRGRIWLAGMWRERDDLHIFGMFLVE